MSWMQNFNLARGQMQNFQQWVVKNQDEWQKHAPPGWTYRGTYAYVLGFGKYHAATLWECSTYGDFDALREHQDEVWTRLSHEGIGFQTDEPGEGVLLRELSDTVILEPEEGRPRP